MKQSYCKRLQIDWQVSSEVNQQLSCCFRCKIQEWDFNRRDCRSVEVKNIMWEMYIIWVISVYFSRWLRDMIRSKECSWFKFFLLIILNRLNARVFCLSSCHHDDEILNQMIFISNFSHSSAFYLTFLSACKLLVACALRLSKSARSRKLCMQSMHSASSSRNASISFKLLITSSLYYI